MKLTVAIVSVIIMLASLGCGTDATHAGGTISEKFHERLHGASRPMLVNFFAPWSPTCEQMKPTIDQLQHDLGDEVEFFSVNVDEAPGLVGRYELQQYPTLILFNNGQEQQRWAGLTPAPVLRKALDESAARSDGRTTAMNERTGAVTFHGNPLTLIGPELSPGDQAPDAVLLDNDLSPVLLSSFAGKVQIISVVPSLDTPVCDIQTRRFNEEAGKLGEDIAVLTISMDLPFAQKRWMFQGNVENIQTLSDHRDAAFGEAYGVLIKELRLLTRSVFVVDRDGTIKYIEIVPEMTSEPNYDAALAAAVSLLQ